MIIKTEVWCHAGNPELGLKDDDCWLPFSFDLNELIAIKECGENEFLGKGKATIWLRSGQEVTINMDYTEVLERWEQFKTRVKLMPIGL